MSDSKSAAAHHPRTTAPWIRQWCTRSFGTDDVCAIHERKCDQRPEAK